MTIIEFFDDAAIENVAGAMLCNPERVALVGKDRKHLERGRAVYGELLAARGLRTEILCYQVNRENLDNIVQALSNLVTAFPDCVFDLSGGQELYLVAVGQILERFGDRVSYQRIDYRSGRLVGDAEHGPLELTVEECVRLNGGEIVSGGSGAVATYNWHFDPEFDEDVAAIWTVCRKDPRAWNAHVNTVGAIDQRFNAGGGLSLSFEPERVVEQLKRGGVRYACSKDVLYQLRDLGLIHSLHVGDRISFTFKNTQIKRCLTVAGQALELVIAQRMRALRDDKGCPLYHDVRVGVVVDWDPDGEEENADKRSNIRTVNEIDVFAVKDTVPVFISCKNGMFDVNELYKLNTVAQRFGGPFAKKALVASELDKLGDRAEFLRARMQDMDIRRVENIDELSDKELDRILRSLWNG